MKPAPLRLNKRISMQPTEKSAREGSQRRNYAGAIFA
ncbi:hypothetical protein FHS49_001719 [Sphingobium boeckii]|uniref:Uncharacterized protein n=1 Tax=Sphingobium boeckii TaxID=1082345 RepID=A0A7W9AHW0_9SPHN|nr:hypothetical protein [Sphingobium boeckii]